MSTSRQHLLQVIVFWRWLVQHGQLHTEPSFACRLVTGGQKWSVLFGWHSHAAALALYPDGAAAAAVLTAD